MSEEKRCTKCGTTKSASEFRTRKTARDGLTSWCRLCLNAAALKGVTTRYKNDAEWREAKLKNDSRRWHEQTKLDPVKLEAERARGREKAQRPEVKTYMRAYNIAYIERPGVRARKRENAQRWVDENRDRARAYWRKYYASPAGKERHRLQESKRRALLRGVLCDLTREQWRVILAAYDSRCVYCKCEGEMTIDHIKPIIVGGEHTAANVVPACFSCNSRKNKKRLRSHVALAKRHAAKLAKIRPFSGRGAAGG